MEGGLDPCCCPGGVLPRPPDMPWHARPRTLLTEHSTCLLGTLVGHLVDTLVLIPTRHTTVQADGVELTEHRVVGQGGVQGAREVRTTCTVHTITRIHPCTNGHRMDAACTLHTTRIHLCTRWTLHAHRMHAVSAPHVLHVHVRAWHVQANLRRLKKMAEHFPSGVDQARLQGEGGEVALAPRQVATDHWSTPASASRQVCTHSRRRDCSLRSPPWLQARGTPIGHTHALFSRNGHSAPRGSQPLLHAAVRSRGCIPWCTRLQELAEWRRARTEQTAVLLGQRQAAAERVSADVARAAVLARRRAPMQPNADADAHADAHAHAHVHVHMHTH